MSQYDGALKDRARLIKFKDTVLDLVEQNFKDSPNYASFSMDVLKVFEEMDSYDYLFKELSEEEDGE